jgi:hypothetical protein
MIRRISALFRSLVLGAINGALYSSVLFFFEYQRIKSLIRGEIEAEKLGLPPVQITSNTLNWPVISVLLVVFFVIASYAVHRYWVRLEKSPILLWQVVGISAVVGWNVIFLVLIWIEKVLTGQTLDYERLTSQSAPLFGPISICLVMLTNSIYGLVLQFMFRNNSMLKGHIGKKEDAY